MITWQYHLAIDPGGTKLAAGRGSSAPTLVWAFSQSLRATQKLIIRSPSPKYCSRKRVS